MSYSAIYKLRRIAAELLEKSTKLVDLKKIKDEYGIKIPPETDHLYIKTLLESLKRMPAKMVKDCGIKVLGFKDLGPSKEYFPNHGKYIEGALVLNTQLTEDPTVVVDLENDLKLNKFDQTLYHELGHGWDDVMGVKGVQLSLLSEWMELSGWSEEPKAGLKRIVIREPGTEPVIGEYYYSPEAKFTRFYAKRNPWDDWADTFSYYVAGLKSFLPENKIEYFDKKLDKYYL